MKKKSAPACRYCGCTEDRACPGGCFWQDNPPDALTSWVCSRCDEIAVALGYRVLEELRACGVPPWSALPPPQEPPSPPARRKRR